MKTEIQGFSIPECFPLELRNSSYSSVEEGAEM